MASTKDLQIAIMGAGMGGLGAALALAKRGFKHVDVYETASSLGFVGAGIQMAPNMGRILDRLGCWDDIEREATCVAGSSIRQGATNVELAHVDMPDIKGKYGFSHLCGHRASLAGHLYKACKKESAITFHFATSLVEVESFAPKVIFKLQPRDGEAFTREADILLGADGIKSVTRSQLLQQVNATPEEAETGQAAYRIMLKREDMEHDPELLSLLDSDEVVRWVGEKRHIIAYSIANKSIYNLSTVQPDDNFASAPSITYTTKGSKKVMLEVFETFCPLVQKMLNLVPEGEVCEWRLRMYKPLPTWTQGSVALLGDACHPTLPHLSQGAAMAIEDGSTIAEVLSLAPDTRPETIAKCLKVYEQSRKEWTSNLVQMAYMSGRTLHLGEGKAKEERDRMFKEHKTSGSVPDKWTSPDVQKMIYTNDCVAKVRSEFETAFAAA
ncbi:salicylate hydroxylase [Fusarium subglutinans]|uniref:Salicylate hydroxylase n=1 Tax=Gibberella subglutinans TaxID=42677 RepID=A0A8H5V5S7_GIBSU|nr:salicylate hydroxylase [Fusarium subglutinans]KAF5612032.1 salicylate hydroxylase [Fusarium subglutinans]